MYNIIFLLRILNNFSNTHVTIIGHYRLFYFLLKFFYIVTLDYNNVTYDSRYFFFFFFETTN
jgi:hypothetical protein